MNFIIKLNREFYLHDTLTISRELLGKYIVRKYNNKEFIMEITETEAYIGSIDKACHAYKGKKTERTKIMFEKGGHAYIYLIYGMYYCFNIVTEKEDNPCAVLIRSGIPVKGIEQMSVLRYSKDYSSLSRQEIKNFSNGPGKLCKAMNITKKLNGTDLLCDEFYICEGKKINKNDINIAKRINIDYAEEAKDFLWRFYI